MSGASHPDPKVGMAFFVAQRLEAEIPEGLIHKIAAQLPGLPT
jgi:hypothetical protein